MLEHDVIGGKTYSYFSLPPASQLHITQPTNQLTLAPLKINNDCFGFILPRWS